MPDAPRAFAGLISGWTTVRTLYQYVGRQVYLEQISLWTTRDWPEALRRAESMTGQLTLDTLHDAEYLQIAQGFLLFDEVENGAELFSLMRRTDLDADAYIDKTFQSGYRPYPILSVGAEWWTVREIFLHPEFGGVFEERLVLWSAGSAEEAVALSLAGAREYAQILGVKHFPLSSPQVYPLSGSPGDGDVVFSSTRDSGLDSYGFVSQHYITGGEFTNTDDD